MIDNDFEKWARKMSLDLEHRNIPGVGQFYECPRTLLAFEAWQASKEQFLKPTSPTPVYGSRGLCRTHGCTEPATSPNYMCGDHCYENI